MFNVRKDGESLDEYLLRCIEQENKDSEEEDKYQQYRQKELARERKIFEKPKNVKKRARLDIFNKEIERRERVSDAYEQYLESIEQERIASISDLFMEEYKLLCNKYQAELVSDYDGYLHLDSIKQHECDDQLF